jgi:hypothetical protein
MRPSTIAEISEARPQMNMLITGTATIVEEMTNDHDANVERALMAVTGMMASLVMLRRTLQVRSYQMADGDLAMQREARRARAHTT